MDILFVIGRILYGGFFLIQGLSLIRPSARLNERFHEKRIPYAKAVVFLASICLVLAGMGILAGRFINSTLTLAVISLSFLSFTIYDYWNRTEPREIASDMANFMRTIALIGAAFMMFSLLQPWNYTL